jgi:hypothetical protein
MIPIDTAIGSRRLINLIGYKTSDSLGVETCWRAGFLSGWTKITALAIASIMLENLQDNSANRANKERCGQPSSFRRNVL